MLPPQEFDAMLPMVMLVEAGADIDARSEVGWTPLIFACDGGHLDAARSLLDLGACASICNDEGYSAFDRVPGQSRELLEMMEAHGQSES